jgi:hypothetical protein
MEELNFYSLDLFDFALLTLEILNNNILLGNQCY